MYENIGSRISKEAARDIEYLAQEEKSDKSKVIRELVAFALKEKMIEMQQLLKANQLSLKNLAK